MSDPDTGVPIILASASPRRIELLRMLGVKFSAIPSGVSENADPGVPLGELVERNALAKASDVAQKLDVGLVIGADTVVALDGTIFGKPADMDDARRVLATLAGRTHKVYSGVAVLRAGDGSAVTDHAVTAVTFRPLSPSQIEKYFEMIDPLDKAGSYAMQGAGGVIIEKIEGCYYNVVGLPLTLLDGLLAKFGARIF